MLMTGMLIFSAVTTIAPLMITVILCLLYPITFKIFGLRLMLYSNIISEIDYQKASTYVRNNIWFQSYGSAGTDIPRGLVIGKYFIAYITSIKGDHNSTISNIWLWSTFVVNSDNVEEPRKELTTLVDFGSCYHNNWVENTKLVPGNPTRYQKEIIDKIVEMMEISDKNGYGYNITVLIHGKAGTGKSMIGKYLALKLNAKYCNSFSPLKPRSGHEELHSVACSTSETPLVVGIDEFDKIVEAAFINPLTKVPKIPPLVYNKATYNLFMDSLCEFPYSAYILTTNKSLDWFNDLDNSTIRDGRINLVIDICETLKKSTDESLAVIIQRKRFTKKIKKIKKIKKDKKKI